MDGADAAPPAVDAAVTEAPAPPPPATLEPSTPATPEPSTPATPEPERSAAEPAPPAKETAPRARGAGDWSDERAGLAGVRGDVAWARRQGTSDLATTLGALLLTLVLGTLLFARLAPDELQSWATALILAALGGAVLLGWWRDRRLKEELARRARRRDQALRAATPLVDDPAVRRPGRELLAVEGWREGLPVELSTPIHIDDEAEAGEDAIVVRVGAPPASRRPRAMTRRDWRGAPAATVPDSLAGWRAQRSLAALRATELLRRFGLTSVAWGPDGVELRGPADHRLLGRDRLDALLAGSVALAQACGLVAVTRVRVLGEQVGQTSCPYCRDDLAIAERAACLACGTEHHTQCLAEHGRCTVWGCGRPWVKAHERTRERT